MTVSRLSPGGAKTNQIHTRPDSIAVWRFVGLAPQSAEGGIIGNQTEVQRASICFVKPLMYVNLDRFELRFRVWN